MIAGIDEQPRKPHLRDMNAKDTGELLDHLLAEVNERADISGAVMVLLVSPKPGKIAAICNPFVQNFPELLRELARQLENASDVHVQGLG